MLIRLAPGVIALAMLCGCHSGTPKADHKQAAQVDEPVNMSQRQPPSTGDLHGWLVGTWSLEGNCATDFLVHYKPDGTIDNSGDLGTWSTKGNEVTEVITQRFANGSEAPEKVDPPESRTYTVSRGDQNRGVLTLKRGSVGILRC